MYNEELMKFREEKISMRVPPLIKNSNTGQAHRYRQRSLLAVERNARLNIFFHAYFPHFMLGCGAVSTFIVRLLNTDCSKDFSFFVKLESSIIYDFYCVKTQTK